MNAIHHKTLPVLITDDSAMVRHRLCSLLEEQASIAVVAQAASAQEAWTMFVRHHPAAVVLDIQLPDGTGTEVLRRIKQSDPACVVIMLTNHDDPVFEQECGRLGADYFLNKATEFEKAAEVLNGLASRQAAGASAETRRIGRPPNGTEIPAAAFLPEEPATPRRAMFQTINQPVLP